MELNEAFKLINKNLEQSAAELGFEAAKTDDGSIIYHGEKGAFKVSHNKNNDVLYLDVSYDWQGKDTQFETLSKSLFELDNITDRDCKSAANEIGDEVTSLFGARKKVDLEKVKMPKAVSRSKAKSGSVNYDTDSLANRFGVLYPEFKDDIKRNIAKYGEFLPETFFTEIGNAKVLDVIKNGDEAEQKKLFKMLGEVYEDGTNEVQDIIGVTILGEMKNDPDMMAVADKYMTEYMAGPVHEINKITAKKNRYTKKLANPPAYKPKKNRTSQLRNALNGPQQ